MKGRGRPKKCAKKLNFNKTPIVKSNAINEYFRNKISIIQGDIRNIDCDAIVNAANIELLGGGGIDGLIHAKAGPELRKKCGLLPVKGKSVQGIDIRCYPGECQVTNTEGTNLTNCQYVFHTVGPDTRKMENTAGFNETTLRSCYVNCLQNVLKHNVKSIAFCCISTGIYQYDSKEAANIALTTVRSWLEINHQSVEKIIFCTWDDKDYDNYRKWLDENLPKDNITYKKQEILPSVDENETIKSDVIVTPILSENLIEPVASTSSSDINNNDDVPVCNDIVDRKFPVKLENEANVCFFNSICQIFYSIH